MRTTVVTLRIPNEVLDRIDHNANQAGETRTERMLRWLPEYYGAGWAEPPGEHVKGPTSSVNIRVDNAVLEHIDASVVRSGLTRTEHILNWQPEYHDRPTENAAAEDTIRARQ